MFLLRVCLQLPYPSVTYGRQSACCLSLLPSPLVCYLVVHPSVVLLPGPSIGGALTAASEGVVVPVAVLFVHD